MSIKHVVIDEQTWDGSDIFIASGFQGRKIVTEAFVEMVNHWGLQNFIMTPAEEFSEDFNAIYK